MNVRVRLRESYNNLYYNADPTWSNNSNLYQKTNLQLYAKKKHLEKNLLKNHRPRTVKDCIPNSRLAQYSNFEYNESREMSYTPSNSSPTVFHNNLMATEPWEIPEVEYLFHWFSCNENHQNFNQYNNQFESPFLRVHSLDERILKERIIQIKVKKIWEQDDFQHANNVPQTHNLTVQICLSPLKNFYVLNKSEVTDNSPCNDLEALQKLLQSIYQQNDSIFKQTTPSSQDNRNHENLITNISSTKQKMNDNIELNNKCKNYNQIEPKLQYFTKNPMLLLQQQSVYFYRTTLFSSWSTTYLSNWNQQESFNVNWSTNRPITNQLFNQNNDTSVKMPQLHHHHPQLTATDSEELEIQALEQYQGSNDNIYQEFTKQDKQ